MTDHIVVISKEELAELIRESVNEALGNESISKANEDVWMTSAEASKYLAISPSTLDRWKAKDKMPYRKIGGCIRFKKSEIDKAFERSNYQKLEDLK